MASERTHEGMLLMKKALRKPENVTKEEKEQFWNTWNLWCGHYEGK